MTQKKITVPVHAGQTLKRWLVQAILEDIGHSAEEFRKLL
jgi:predicted RNA binding protein YcfA (HicA-like mRNA interferase family)